MLSENSPLAILWQSCRATTLQRVARISGGGAGIGQDSREGKRGARASRSPFLAGSSGGGLALPAPGSGASPSGPAGLRPQPGCPAGQDYRRRGLAQRPSFRGGGGGSGAVARRRAALALGPRWASGRFLQGGALSGYSARRFRASAGPGWRRSGCKAIGSGSAGRIPGFPESEGRLRFGKGHSAR